MGKIMFLTGVLLAALLIVPASEATDKHGSWREAQVLRDALHAVQRGRRTFRYDTFGDEAFWTDTLRLNEALAGAANGGVGPGISPATALSVGLKVDVTALPKSLKKALKRGEVDLDDPATTLALLQLEAVVGLRGKVSSTGDLETLGITCALCHSTVDDSFVPGIGQRLDGWANRDLDPGVIISLAPDLSVFTTLLGVDEATVKTVLTSWGVGKFDASLLLDGKAFRPDGGSAAVLIPPAFGLAGVNLHTWTGWGGVSHWNALVATLEMGGQGTLYDPRLDDMHRFPVAAANGFGNVRPEVDRVTPKLPDLQMYQLALEAPKPPRRSFDGRAARRGKHVFNGQGDCARCHVPPLFTEPGWNLHTPAEIGIDDFQAARGPEDRYRTAPLRGLWTHGKGGYYHDGRFATLLDVVAHYDQVLGLSLSGDQKHDLVEYLKSL